MPYEEARARRNGMPVPIECLFLELDGKENLHALHYHDYTELLFGVSGKSLVLVGNRRMTLAEGDMLVIHTHEPHYVTGGGEPSSYIVVKFLPRILLTGADSYPEYSYMLTLLENSPDKQILFSSVELKKTDLPALFAHLIEEWRAADFGYELSLRVDVTRIFLYILRRWRASNPAIAAMREDGQGILLGQAVSFIGEHYAELSEGAVAAACGVSRTYFSRVFRRGMRVSFTAYVTGVRLREAARLLLTAEYSVTAIAQEVGFSTTSYFIEKFRSVYGETPSRYRELWRHPPKNSPPAKCRGV